MKMLLQRTIDYLRTIRNQNEELLWAQVWDDTKNGLDWIKGLPAISPGRSAVGYNYLYVMTRILEEKRPHSVLDIGLGVSSALISTYFDSMGFQDGNHTIIEHNVDWGEYYVNNKRLPLASKIVYLECVEKVLNGCTYNAYKDFDKTLNGQKFSVISVDAPIAAGKAYRYARRDIVEVLPDILEEDFVIVIDDAQRKGETATVREIQELLKANKIDVCTGYYAGISTCCVITSANNRFLCSL